ncbi:MAG: hypothetical protein JNJ46_29270 [Myxococcales bacterium]|nr:hypothetical protein [Myxococcales bacterium]
MKAGLRTLFLCLALSLLSATAWAKDDGPVELPVPASPSAAASPSPSAPTPNHRDAERRTAADAPEPSAAVTPRVQPAAVSTDAPALPEPSLATPRVVYKRRYNMALFGGALLLASYTADRLLMGDLSKSGFAWIPLAGPWFLLDLQVRQPVPSSATALFLVIDGVLQAGGLTMTVLGLVLRERRLTVRLAAPTAAPKPIPSAVGTAP